jgi:hypothetical protein
MSSFLSSYENRSNDQLKNQCSTFSTVKLNEVLHSSLQNYNSEIQKGNIILRCDSLPAVEGDFNKLERLFTKIISIIFDTHIQNTKQFLYITCIENPLDVRDISLKNGHKYYEIQFKTNLDCELIWKRTEKKKIEECEQILSEHAGKLKNSFINTTGCFLSVILPGKL